MLPENATKEGQEIGSYSNVRDIIYSLLRMSLDDGDKGSACSTALQESLN